MDRLSRIPLFGFVSVDELFRITSLGLESRHPEGHALHVAGASVEHVECLIEGAVQATDAEGRSSEHRAPSVFGLEEALQGAPTLRTVLATEPVVSFRIRAADFMTMISDNVWLAQGLFRMLLADRETPALPAPSRFSAGSRSPRPGSRQPVDQAFLLSEHPLLARATASQLLAIVGAAREVPLVQGQVLFEADTAAALHLVLDGALLLQASDGTAVPVVSGTTIDVAETLAGAPTRWRGT